jgi:hypothetical protein
MHSIATMLMWKTTNVHCLGGTSMNKGGHWWARLLNKSLGFQQAKSK